MREQPHSGQEFHEQSADDVFEQLYAVNFGEAGVFIKTREDKVWSKTDLEMTRRSMDNFLEEGEDENFINGFIEKSANDMPEAVRGQAVNLLTEYAKYRQAAFIRKPKNPQ